MCHAIKTPESPLTVTSSGLGLDPSWSLIQEGLYIHCQRRRREAPGLKPTGEKTRWALLWPLTTCSFQGRLPLDREAWGSEEEPYNRVSAAQGQPQSKSSTQLNLLASHCSLLSEAVWGLQQKKDSRPEPWQDPPARQPSRTAPQSPSRHSFQRFPFVLLRAHLLSMATDTSFEGFHALEDVPLPEARLSVILKRPSSQRLWQSASFGFQNADPEASSARCSRADFPIDVASSLLVWRTNLTVESALSLEVSSIKQSLKPPLAEPRPWAAGKRLPACYPQA